jgi:hypothetical protein
MKTRGLRLNSLNAFAISREMRLRRDSSFNRNLKSPVAPGPVRGATLKMSPILFNPAKSLEIKLGGSGIAKPKFEV